MPLNRHQLVSTHAMSIISLLECAGTVPDPEQFPKHRAYSWSIQVIRFEKIAGKGQVWWYMPIISASRRLRPT